MLILIYAFGATAFGCIAIPVALQSVPSVLSVVKTLPDYLTDIAAS